MSRTFRNVNHFFTYREINNDILYYLNTHKIKKTKHKNFVVAFDGKARKHGNKGEAIEGNIAGWSDDLAPGKKKNKSFAKRKARKQLKIILEKEVFDYYEETI